MADIEPSVADWYKDSPAAPAPSVQTHDPVNHPPHYGGDTTYEVIKVIEAWSLGFNDGNAVKYIGRAGKKGDRLEDLRKARWYLDREIARMEAAARG
mgnify:CR=1 FL=1